MASNALIEKLRAITLSTIKSAGPRYSPAFAPGSPNLRIEQLERAVAAQCLSTAFRTRLSSLATDLRSDHALTGYIAGYVMRRRSVTFESIAVDLSALAEAATSLEVRSGFRRLQLHLSSVGKTIDSVRQTLRAELSSITETQNVSPTPGRPTRQEQLESRLRSVAELAGALDPIVEMANVHEGVSAPNSKPLLLLGEWGTGKTHFACDIVLSMIEDGVPAVVVLAPTLDGGDPLDQLADQLGFWDSKSMLDQLEEHAKLANRRALIVIDAVNEADRDAWIHRLPELLRKLSRRPDVALILTCRTPFDQQIFDARQKDRFRVVYHPGFDTQEFDAQLVFFEFYELPTLNVPLLATEFARPLFLKLMCEGLVRLSKRTQKKHLEGISSGQKGMTYVLENFVGSVGEEIEERHGLNKMACWYLLKGRQEHLGIAGRLADLRREWLPPEALYAEIKSQLSLRDEGAKSLVRDMVTSGLLIDQLQYQDGEYVDGFALPYQRFSDHLVARHLLAASLDTSSISNLRRSFYSNRRLGAVFQIHNRGFAEPGVASALMVEFPERVKRFAGSVNSTELIAYLPSERQLLYPVAEAFTEGLYWRDAQSFSAETEGVVRTLLKHRQPAIANQLFEVLVGIASRPTHPWNSAWLWSRLGELDMAARDLSWSEFIRLADEQGNVRRLLTWSERPSALSALSANLAANLLRLLALTTTTTDREVRDRATRAMVFIGECHPKALFEMVEPALSLNDPYVAERVLGASYGLAMRHWGSHQRHEHFDAAVAALAKILLSKVLQAGAPYATWHTLTRSYAEGIVQVLKLIRPRLVGRQDQGVLNRSPTSSESPFRDVSSISPSDVIDGEWTIHMDFGNYTMGRLVNGRSNYDMDHPVYVEIRAQIADRIGRLGYRKARFEQIDKIIAEYSSARSDAHQTDRYGKKYAWIAYFEMFGLRSRTGQLDYFGRDEPRSTDCDIDPSFPTDSPIWRPEMPSSFEGSAVDHEEWLVSGRAPTYTRLLELDTADGLRGSWVLLAAAIREGAPDGRQTQAWVTTAFVSERSMSALRREFDERKPQDHDLPESGTDFYTYFGEVPWSKRFGSDIRRADGTPKTMIDRAFNDYSRGKWQAGFAVEATTRIWGWEPYHSELNQVRSIFVPSPAITEFLGLRSVRGSADLVDADGRVVSIFRRFPGPSYGSHFLYVRKDAIEAFAKSRSLRLVTVIRGERTLDHDYIDRPLPEKLQAVFQSRVADFSSVVGLDEMPDPRRGSNMLRPQTKG